MTSVLPLLLCLVAAAAGAELTTEELRARLTEVGITPTQYARMATDWQVRRRGLQSVAYRKPSRED